MSLYKNDIAIDGIQCGMVLREGDGYTALFERDFASLEDIEGIQWDRPDIAGDCILPAGCGFDVTDISYSHSERCWRVRLALGRQYLGDVTGYQEQVEELTARSSALEEELSGLRGQLAEADEALIALYEAALPGEDAGTEEGVTDESAADENAAVTGEAEA